MPEIRPGRYRHYKGNEHTVLGVARHSETLEGWISGPRLGRRHILHAVAFPEAAVAAKRRKPALGADAAAVNTTTFLWRPSGRGYHSMTHAESST